MNFIGNSLNIQIKDFLRNVDLVAEGIETEAQRDYVESAGFDFVNRLIFCL